MKPRFRTFWLVLVSLFLAATGLWVLYLRPIVLRGNQVMNCSNLQMYRAAVEGYRRLKGGYPRTLEEAVTATGVTPRKPIGQDVWGHELVYRAEGTAFIIVSLGKDGRSDGIDFWSLRSDPVKDWRSEERRCSDFNADAMVTADDASRGCCK